MTPATIHRLKRRFEEDGFVVLRRYLGEPQLTELRQRAERLANAMLARREQAQPRQASEDQGAGTAKSRPFANVLKNLNNEDPWFARQLNAGSHVPLVTALVDSPLTPASAAWFNRPPGSAERIDPHIDGVGRPRNGCVGATIWIALDAADVGNGCLHYGRGSHKVEYPPGLPIPGFDVNSDNAVAVAVEAGDAVVHSALTVHWSGENRSDRPRRAASFFYWTGADAPSPAGRPTEIKSAS